ncbi:MAG: hypothetical protein KA352_10875, partial [Flavobacteriales bacterium]|nr:hypothetical protein [Flavobacteriales bacterium]
MDHISRSVHVTLALLTISMALAQGFPSTSVDWWLPAGGQVDGGVNQGFNLLSAIGYDTNSDTWSTVDINGDSKPDLVCTGTRAANGYVTEFSPGNNSYWKVYLNTGNGFSGTSVNWSLPAGGQIDGGVNQGFNLLSAIGYDTNSDTWSTVDINGDSKPDLVCTGTRAANGYVTEFSPGNNSYWKVYLNTGNGFSGTSVNWSLPA